MKNRKGFTLIELLAVIVILGLLMAIAIPSVTKYITESRKKTVVSTIGNYMTAIVNDVNDLTYTFTEANTIYAVPIECIALERGGINPFGAWHQASNAYWAYVLVQYDDETSSYRYGYTFKDSAGYGLYPTAQSKLNEQGKQIQINLNLTKPTPGNVANITSLNNWRGFVVDSTTNLVVLIAESEGNVGDGETTCTLQQKGDNYDVVEEEKVQNGTTLVSLIKKNNKIITSVPTLTTSSNNTTDASGLYVSYDTNTGEATYYYRGKVTNNYVSFAGFNWRIIRINENGTVRLILNGRVVNNSDYVFNTTYAEYGDMYYSNSDTAKLVVDEWYDVNIRTKGLDSYVVNSSFCEQAKVKYASYYTSGNAEMIDYSSYIPNFKCVTDGNGKGIINSKVGLITYDELVYAGGYPYQINNEYYLDNNGYFWTMSSTGFNSSNHAIEWYVTSNGDINRYSVENKAYLRAVINLNAGVLATGTGTSKDPYIIQTK